MNDEFDDDESMMGHQRDIMAVLGIDVWIPKDAPCQPHQPAVWRDQAPEDLISSGFAENISEILLTKSIAERLQPPAPVLNAHEDSAVFADQSAQHDAVKEPPAVPVVSQEPAVPMLQIPAFAIEALVLPQCVLLIDSTAVTAEQQMLWRNIQRAVSAEFHHLMWPFAWQNMQDGRGAASYVQGFADAFSMEKTVLCLGEVPYLQSSRSIHLASLQDMLDQPLLKKRLWQFMQNKIKE